MMSVAEYLEKNIQLELTGDGNGKGSVYFSIDFPAFDGHFPGDPILPGITYIAMAYEIAGRMNYQPEQFQVRKASFHRLVRPESRLDITVKTTQKEHSTKIQINFEDQEKQIVGVISLQIEGLV